MNTSTTADANCAKSTLSYSEQYTSVMGKCQAIRNSVHRSTKAADAVKQICSDEGKCFLVPCATRWNSIYDVVCQVLELKDNLNEVSSALELPKLKTTHVDFLIVYRRVLQPLA